MAHKKCPMQKAWPPRFRPTLDPNEVIRQINALCAHLGKLGFSSGGLPVPQRLPPQAGARPTPPSSPRHTSPRQVHIEKETTVATTRRDSAEESPRSSPSCSDGDGDDDDRGPGVLSRRAKATPKRQRPQATPLTTPSPQPKDARLADEEQKAEVPMPTPMPTKPQPQEKPFRINLTPHDQFPKPTLNTKTGRKNSRSRPSELVQVNNVFEMREYNLQEEVRAAGGRTVTEDRKNKYEQVRALVEGEPSQSTKAVSQHDHCRLYLTRWRARDPDTVCNLCRIRRSQGPYNPGKLRTWTCLEHEYEVCLRCIPVVLKTPDRTKSN